MMYEYHTSLTTPKYYPAILRKNVFCFDDMDTTYAIRQGVTQEELWGDVHPFVVIDDEEWPMPTRLELEWVAVAEFKYYSLKTTLNDKTMEELWKQKDKEESDVYTHIAVGIAPYGQVAVWMHGLRKQTLIGWFKGTMEPVEPILPLGFTVQSLCTKCMTETQPEVKTNLEEHGLPNPHLYDRLMQQFTYRFVPMLRWWNYEVEEWWEYDEEMEGDEMPTVDFVEVKCHDGTFDRLRDGSLLNYHEAGKPSRVGVGWHVGKREYSAYFFFSHDELAQVFRTCYGAHPDTKVDFLLMIDPECDKYETALFRYGMNEPLPIGSDACQVLAFRNKFECYRSPNYTQPKGAWR